MKKYVKGDIMHLGSEHNIRRNGLKQRNNSGKVIEPSIGHKGQEGSNPNFSDFAEHDALCIDVKDDIVYMKCTCGLEWDFSQTPIITSDVPKNYGLLD